MKGCLKHSNQPMSFFCEVCAMSICRDCTVLDHKDTEGHIISNISQAEIKQRQALAMGVENAQQTLSTLGVGMQQVESESSMLSAARDAALKDMEHAWARAGKALEKRKLQLTKSLLDHYNTQQEYLLGQREKLHASVKMLTEATVQSESTLKSGVLVDVVNVNKCLSADITETQANFESLDYGKNNIAFDSVIGWEAFEEGIAQLGQIYFKGALPTDVQFRGKSAKAGHKAVISLEFSNHKGEKINVCSAGPITVTVTDPQDSKINTVVNVGTGGTGMSSGGVNNEVSVSFLPQISGHHKISACYLGVRLRSEQTHVNVTSNNPVLRFGEQGSGNGAFLSPRAVALDNENCLYIADTGNRLIQKLSSDGRFIHQFNVNGHNEDCSTCDLALDIKNELIICTETLIGTGINPTMGNNVLVYNLSGEIQHVYTNSVMRCALCIATNSRGDIIVSDYLVHSLFMYDAQGNFLRRVGNAGMFNHPAFICVAEDDSIIVSDTNNDCIQIFDKEGIFKRQFGSSGSGKGQLKQPFGVATDGEYILVVDSGNRRVQVFNIDGTFVSMIESKSDPLLQPRGMAITRDGCVYVADRDHHCIKKYRYRDTPPPDKSQPSPSMSSSVRVEKKSPTRSLQRNRTISANSTSSQ